MSNYIVILTDLIAESNPASPVMVTAWIVGDLDDPQATELVAEALTAVVSRASPIAACALTKNLTVTAKGLPHWLCTCTPSFAHVRYHGSSAGLHVTTAAACEWECECHFCGDPLRNTDKWNSCSCQ
jgi:hypothetical protein